MANSDKNILITPNRSAATGVNPTIRFTGADNTPITLRVLDNGTVSFEGTSGQLFSVSDGMTGTIFSVNDISGIPSIEVLDTGLVKLNQYNGQTVIGTSAALTSGSVASMLSIVNRTSTTPGIMMRASAGATASMLEFQNSATTVVASIAADGAIRGNFLTNTTNTNPYIDISGGSVIVLNRNTITNTVFGVRGMSGQTGSLQVWQNSTPSTVASVSNTGAMTALSYNGLTITTTTGTLTLVNGSSLITAGAFSTTLTSTGTTNVTLPTSGTLMANPMTTTGDLILGGASGAATRLAIGANAFVLTSNGTTATWAAATSGYTAPTLGTTSIASGATVSNVNGLTINSTTIPTSATLLTSTSTASALTSFGASPTITTPQLQLETTSRTTEGSVSWDSTNDYLRIGSGTVAKSFFPFDVNINAKTAAYALVLADANTLVQMNGAFAFTVPLNSTTPWPIGTNINLLAITAGVSVTFTGGITFYATPGRNLRASGSMATLIKLGTDTWVLTGDLTA